MSYFPVLQRSASVLRWRYLLFCILLLCIVVLPRAAAQSSHSSATGNFWEQPSKEKVEYDRLMKEADDFALAAVSTRSQVMARRAVEAYEAATKANASSGEPHFRAGEVLSAFMIGGNIASPRYLRRVITHWRQFEKKSPMDSRLLSILSERAIALTKLQGKANLLAAIEDYHHALSLMDQSSDRLRPEIGRLVSNQAELYMMVGQLEHAITGYRQALEYQSDTVYGYGLAVALDRNRQRRQAREVARTFARADNGQALQRSGTFFVPPGERLYYIALFHEGKAQWQQAISAYQEFIRRVPGSLWIARAQENIKILGPAVTKQRKQAAALRKQAQKNKKRRKGKLPK